MRFTRFMQLTGGTLMAGLVFIAVPASAQDPSATCRIAGAPDGHAITLEQFDCLRRIYDKRLTVLGIYPETRGIPGSYEAFALTGRTVPGKVKDPDAVAKALASVNSISSAGGAVVTYCYHDKCGLSDAAARQLRDADVPVYVFRGGIKEWQEAKRAVEVIAALPAPDANSVFMFAAQPHLTRFNALIAEFEKFSEEGPPLSLTYRSAVQKGDDGRALHGNLRAVSAIRCGVRISLDLLHEQTFSGHREVWSDFEVVNGDIVPTHDRKLFGEGNPNRPSAYDAEYIWSEPMAISRYDFGWLFGATNGDRYEATYRFPYKAPASGQRFVLGGPGAPHAHRQAEQIKRMQKEIYAVGQFADRYC